MQLIRRTTHVETRSPPDGRIILAPHAPAAAARLAMRLDAGCDAALAVFLVASTWDALYEFLGLPVPKPAFYAQLLGVALVALAIVEWTIAGRPGQREVAGGVAVGSSLGASVLVVWLVSDRVNAELQGKVILWAVAAFLGLEAALHARGWAGADRHALLTGTLSARSGTHRCVLRR